MPTFQALDRRMRTAAANANAGRVANVQGKIAAKEGRIRDRARANQVRQVPQQAAPAPTAAPAATPPPAASPPGMGGGGGPLGGPNAAQTKTAGGGRPPAAGPGGVPPPPTLAGPVGPTGGPGSAGTEFGQIFDQQFGRGNPFAVENLFGANPIATALQASQFQLERNLADQGAAFSGAGLGNSSRAALERGAAIGTASSQLGDILSQRGLSQRAQDRDRALSAFGLATQGQQTQQQMALNTLLGLGNLGGQVNLAGNAEQELPGQQGLLALLNSFTNTRQNQVRDPSDVTTKSGSIPGLL